MSIHLTSCAATQPIPAAAKLALIAFADSADATTHISAPGYEKVQTWASVGRSRSAELVAELVGLELLEKHRAGRRGRRAEYVVFPRGCCEVHPRPEADEDLPTDSIEGSGTPDAVTVTGSTIPDPNRGNEKGSGYPDSLSGTGSTPPDPNDGQSNGAATPDPSRGKGPESVRHTGPLPKQLPIPPLPPDTEATSPTAGCSKHRDKPHANCRGCGTTTKQVRDATNRADAARRKTEEQEAWQAERRRRVAEGLPPDLTAERASAVRDQYFRPATRSTS